MEKQKIYKLAIILALAFLVLPTVSAHIEISDMGHYEDIEGLTGYVDCINVAEYDLSGAILVFVDGNIVAGKIITARVRYVAGFRCAPPRTLEFLIPEAEGKHRIVAHVFSMNNSVQCTYEYYAEGIEEKVEEVEREQEKDWLSCWGEE